MIKVFIVVLNWNGGKDTVGCLRSLKKLLITNYELQMVVVDNGSTDDSIKQIKEQPAIWRAKIKNIHLIENKENLGFAGGSNAGVKYAIENGADFVLILNNDTLVDQSLLVKFLEAADIHKDAGILSPKIYFAPGFEFHKERYSQKEKGRVIWYAGGVMDWENVLGSNYGVDDTDIGQYSDERQIDFATGACMFVRREVFEKVGFFDTKYYLYLEDVDFSLRAKNAGWKIFFVPDAHVWHKVSRSSAIGGGLNDYFITRNRMLFGIRYAPWRAKIALLRESVKLILSGREWQKKGILDFYFGKFGKGSWK